MTHPCELATSATIAALRAAAFDTPAENNAHITPDLYLSWDDEKAEIALQSVSDVTTLLALKGDVSGTPRWFSLNIGLGKGEFKAGDVLGIVLELESPAALDSAPFIRTAWRKGGYADTQLADAISVAEGRQVVTLLHTITAGEPLCNEVFHTLVLPLPGADFQLSLNDMRLFVIDAERGLRPVPPQMASAE
jgi:hypothetical protein